MPLSEQDRHDLQYAKGLLEHPSLASRIAGFVGTPLEMSLNLLPARVSEVVTQATHSALVRALDVVVTTLDDDGPRPSRNVFHKVLATASGAGGGAFGLLALPVELPLSTVVMVRSIADIARSEGERLKSVETKLACIEVLALGGQGTGDDAAETGYFAVRAALGRAVSEAAATIAQRGLIDEGAPAIVRLIAQLASRFGATVSEKVAAQAVPIVGAAGGAIVNLIFIDHFQDMARGHFIVRRLERTHGRELVRAQYDELRL